MGAGLSLSFSTLCHLFLFPGRRTGSSWSSHTLTPDPESSFSLSHAQLARSLAHNRVFTHSLSLVLRLARASRSVGRSFRRRRRRVSRCVYFSSFFFVVALVSPGFPSFFLLLPLVPLGGRSHSREVAPLPPLERGVGWKERAVFSPREPGAAHTHRGTQRKRAGALALASR